MGMDKLLEVLPEFDVISFDIFDTLLLRPYLKPSDLFFKIEFDESAKGFALDRICAETTAKKRVREQGRVEPTIDEIYAQIPQWETFKSKELEAERACLVVNPEMQDVFNAAKSQGKRILVVSDMYLSANFLKDVLKEKGISGWDGFYVSSEKQAAKWSGELYELILKDVNVAPDKIIHIGDNSNSDVIKANEKGVVAYWYQNVVEQLYAELPFSKSFLKGSPSVEKRNFVGSVALGWHFYKCTNPQLTYWNRIGFLFAGPLGYSYMRFVGESAKGRGFERLLFVARDGYILQKIFSVLYPDMNSDYFYASRSQAILGIKYFGKTEVGLRARRRFCIKYLENISHVSLTIEQKTHYEMTGELPNNVKCVLDEVAVRKRAEAEAYFSRFDINPGKTAIVDGDSTHFTVQKFVSAIIGYDVFTYYLFTNRPVENAETMAFSNWNMRYLHFAEFLFGAPTPPLDDVVNGELVFKRDVSFFERFKMRISDDISDGAVFCAKVFKRYLPNFNHDMWLDWNDAFMDNLAPIDREMFSLARNSIDIGHDSEYCPVLVPAFQRRRFAILGKTLLTAKLKRRALGRYWSVRLFGKLPLFDIRFENATRIMGVVRRMLKPRRGRK